MLNSKENYEKMLQEGMMAHAFGFLQKKRVRIFTKYWVSTMFGMFGMFYSRLLRIN